MSFETSALLLTWVALALLALVVAGLVRQVHALSRGVRPPDLALSPGAPAPGLDRLALEPGRANLVLFLSDDCGVCATILREAAALAGNPPIRAVFAGDALDVDAADGLRVLAGRTDLFEEYRIPATPFAVLVGADERIVAAEPTGSVRALHELLSTERPADLTDDRLRPLER